MENKKIEVKRKLNWLIWLIIWGVLGIPFATILVGNFRRREETSDDTKLFSTIRFLGAIVVGGVMILANTVDSTMIWVGVGWFLAWTAIELFVANNVGGIIAAILLILILLYGVVLGIHVGVNNAIYFDRFIQKCQGVPIQNEIPDNLLRLTTENLALSIARQHMAEFGSNVRIVNTHITMYQGKLVWVSMVSVDGAWGQNYNVEGLIIVDANNPDATPTIVRQKFPIAEGLSWNPVVGSYGEARAKGYYGIDTAIKYGRIYPAQDPEGKWKIIMATYQLDYIGVRRYSGVFVIDQYGDVVDRFSAKNIPQWISQPFDEQDFLEDGIKDWGTTRRGDEFDLLAGGFMQKPASQNRVAITEDTRYIYDPDTKQVVAIVQVHPIREKGELTLAGIFKATHEGICYYDISRLNLQSGPTAGKWVISRMPPPAGGAYFSQLELLYPVRVGNTTRLVYFVPVYWSSDPTHTNMRLEGLGIADGLNPDSMVFIKTGQGITGQSLVSKAKESFRALFAEKAVDKAPVFTNATRISGTLIAKHKDYVEGGYTRIPLTIRTETNKTEDVLAKVENLKFQEWLKILKANPGERLTIAIDANKNVVNVF